MHHHINFKRVWYKDVNLLYIALPIIGQWVTDNLLIKLFMLYKQILRLKIDLLGWEYWPKASKSAGGGVRGVVQAQKSAAALLLTRHEQAEMVWIIKYKCTVLNRWKINPANYLQS